MKPTIIITLDDTPMGSVKSIVSYPEGQPGRASEIHDDWFPEETAKQVAKNLAANMRKENPDLEIKLKL